MQTTPAAESITIKVEVTSDRAEEGIEDYENNNDEEALEQNFRSSVIFMETNPANIDSMIEAEQIQEAYNSDSQLNPDIMHSKKILKQRHKEELDSEERKSLDP